MKFRKIATPFLLAASLHTGAMAETRRTLATPTDAPWSGISYLHIFMEGNGYCTPWIIDHGLLGIAKHCFKKAGLDEAAAKRANFQVGFYKSNTFYLGDTPDVHIKKSDITDIVFDSGDNDIAYVLYDRTITAGVIPLDLVVSQTPPAPDTQLQIAGNAKRTGKNFYKVMTMDCTATGRTGRFKADFNGLQYGTTCAGWYGTSGGAVYDAVPDDNGKRRVYGVVSYTFDVNWWERVEKTLVRKDDFGDYVTMTISPFSEARDLQTMLVRARGNTLSQR